MNIILHKDTLYGLTTAILFSSFIYLEEYGFTLKLINTFFGILAIGAFLYIPKRSVLIAGFFIGLLWFYWVGYSFKYHSVGYMAPFVTFFFGIFYMLFFGILSLTNKVYIRVILFVFLSFFQPLDSNWMQVNLVFVDSYLGVMRYQLIIILIALALPKYINNQYKFTPLLLLILASSSLTYDAKEQKLSDLKIKLIQTDIKQQDKWKKHNRYPTINMIHEKISDAISKGYDLIVFPETVYPIHLNKKPQLIQQLQEFSYKISIIAGGLMYEDKKYYNVTYMFENGKYSVAKKMILVPFGEYIPIPEFAQEFVNKTFLSGEAVFSKANQPTDFIIKGVKFRNAICYEATSPQIYDAKDDAKIDFVIVTSNNAWFTPSIEPTLQKLLLRFYARKIGATIYHSTNYKGTRIIQ